MSGPIIRKYGFPNFEKIFGKRALEHGVDDADKSEQTTTQEKPAEAASGTASASKAEESKRPADGT
jgi:hypothetical protein